jgi:hypothetical protein
VPGATELPSFAAVEMTEDFLVIAGVGSRRKPAAINDASRRRWRTKVALIEIELEDRRWVRADREVGGTGGLLRRDVNVIGVPPV